MAKSKKAPKSKSKTATYAKAKVSKVLDQVKEPLSLLGTLKEEGMANALTLLSLASTMASGAKKNLRLESLKPQLRELISSLGFATKEDFESLASRVDELEHKLSQKEFSELSRRSGMDDEE
jgi:polyhydroxyalkanoate synthesis regulator phasin